MALIFVLYVRTLPPESKPVMPSLPEEPTDSPRPEPDPATGKYQTLGLDYKGESEYITPPHLHDTYFRLGRLGGGKVRQFPSATSLGPHLGEFQGVPVPVEALKETSWKYGAGRVPFVSSVDAYFPHPEVATPWELVGILTPTTPSDSVKDEILNLFQKYIATDYYQYRAQDKNGFILPVSLTGLGKNYLEDADVISSVTGKESVGSYKVTLFNKNKFIYF